MLYYITERLRRFMSAIVIDGKMVSGKIREQLKVKVDELSIKIGRQPVLAVILVGEDAASQVYVKNKILATESVGMKSLSYRLPADTAQEDVIALIEKLNNDDSVDGILLQLPLPKHLDEKKIAKIIRDDKDVDGFSAYNVGNLLLGTPTYISCTPYGVMELLKHYNISVASKNAVIIGRSNIVGKPMLHLLMQENATVTVCHSRTCNIAEIVKKADIVIAALGRARFVTADMVKEGAVVIDVGINRVDGKLVGDVDYDNVKDIASYITPVPGGVGPMTITMLLCNTYKSAQDKA